MAEWLGSGLQSRLQRFESARRLERTTDERPAADELISTGQLAARVKWSSTIQGSPASRPLRVAQDAALAPARRSLRHWWTKTLSTNALVEDDEPEKKAKPKSTKKRLVIGGVGIAVVVATFVFVLPQIANYRSVWNVVKGLTWEQIGLLLITMVLNLATYAPPWMAALPGLRYLHGSVLTLASTASTYIAPGGAAVGVAASYGVLRSWGFKGRPVTIAVAVTGIWNQFAMLGFPIIALAILTLQNERNSLLETVAVIGLVIFVIAVAGFTAGLWTENLARKVGRPRGADLELRAARDPARARHVERASRSCASATRRSSSWRAAGTSSRSRRSPASSPCFS